MAIADLMPREQAFHVRTGSIYKHMSSRVAEKRNKNGKLIRVGRVLQFTLQEFRSWLTSQLGGSRDGCVPCSYCRRPLTSEDLRIDHATPLTRGGALDLGNLACCCDVCNRAKGQLTAGEYVVLQDNLDRMLRAGDLGLEGYKDIWKRLRGQVAVWRKLKPKAGVRNRTAEDGEKELF